MDTITKTNLNDWVRGTASTYKILADNRILFIQDDSEGFHLYSATITGHDSRGQIISSTPTYRGCYSRAVDARCTGDRLI